MSAPLRALLFRRTSEPSAITVHFDGEIYLVNVRRHRQAVELALNDLVGLAAVAAGADGLLVEVHPDPDHALSDGAQSLRPEQFEELMGQLRIIAPAVGRTL